MKRIVIISISIIFGTISFGQTLKEKEIIQVIEHFFVAMKTQDSVLLKKTLQTDAIFFTSFQSEDRPKLIRENVQEFITAVGTPHEDIWDERISNLKIQRDGNLASVWMDYHFYLNDQFSHCGINVMQLFFDGDKWRIFEIADTRRSNECL